jgi:hypothetical protein
MNTVSNKFRIICIALAFFTATLIISAVFFLQDGRSNQQAYVYAEDENESNTIVDYSANINFVASEEEALSRFSSDYLQKQSVSNSYYEKLMASYPDSKSGEKIYPDSYGGAFIDNAGNLVIYEAGSDSQRLKASKEIEKTIGTSDFKIIPAKYSYNELLKVMDTLNAKVFADTKSSIATNVLSFYLSDMENCIVVELKDNGKNQIALFEKNILASPTIKFEKSEEEEIVAETGSINDEPLTNLTTANYSAAGGDSGGIVYYLNSAGTRYTAGIHSGASSSTRYFVKAAQINSALGTTRY